VHSRHRNPSVPEHYTREMAITDTAVHDFDTVRWLLGEELVTATVLTPRRSRHGGDLQDPLMMLFETESGALVDVETSVNIRYGYDIRGEVVGEDGTVALADSSPVLVRRAGTVSGRVPEDWRERFIRAYDVELQEWVDAVAAGRGATGPSSWDGYAAAVVSDAAVEALRTGTKVAVVMRDKPDLYAKEG
jgi:myo-inositol 2-dehydrogenase/D-chiro-inositol 1-dehydrogenase